MQSFEEPQFDYPWYIYIFSVKVNLKRDNSPQKFTWSYFYVLCSLRSSGEPRSSRSSDLLPPLPAPPDFTQVREETGMREVRVGPQRVSVRRDLDFTPDLAAQLAREASNAIAVGAVSEIDHVVQEEDESESSAEDRF